MRTHLKMVGFACCLLLVLTGSECGCPSGGAISAELDGLWAGESDVYRTCFYVSEDGMQLMPSRDCNLEPSNRTPYSYEMRGESNAGVDQDGNECGFGFGYEEPVPIVDDSFAVEGHTPSGSSEEFSFSGTFNGESASGTTTKVNGQSRCDIDWTATRMQDGTGGTGGSGGTGGEMPLSCDVCGQLDCAEFSDDTFAEADWEDSLLLQGGTAGYSVAQGTDDQGNPDPYRFVRHEVGMESSIWIAHDKTEPVYDASVEGPIRSLHYSFDGRALEGSRQASIRPLARQNGRWFWTDFSTYQLINENGWVTKRWDDASLIPAGHSEQLDLSEDGAPITVGFSSGASHTTGVENVVRNSGVDNWRVIICNE